ncbi:hypothetical protein BH11PAT4_BH11PAT4_1530 [soil metagenome]
MRKAALTIILVLVLSLGFQSATKRNPRTGLRMWMLNVGQGASVLIQTPSNHYLLFDGGPGSNVLSELGEVLPVWQRTLDAVALSHPHADHIRGLIAVLGRYEVGEVWTSGSSYKSGDYTEWVQVIKQKQIATKNVASPDTMTLGELSVRVIHPPKPVVGKIFTETHDGTLSLLLSYSLRSIILAGDVDQKHEASMVSSCKPPACNLDSDILQVAHHGSASGTSSAFLKATTPLLALIPVGEGNKFKHPRAEVLERLAQANATVFRTDQDGRILVVVTNDSLEVTSTTGKRATLAQTPQPAPT